MRVLLILLRPFWKKKSDSEIADILGYKSKQAVQYKRAKIESKLREVMKPWIE